MCGASIPRGARSCPECGADERTGWREQSIYDGLDLPAEAFGENEETKLRRSGLSWYWLAAGMLVLLALVFAVLGLG